MDTPEPAIADWAQIAAPGRAPTRTQNPASPGNGGAQFYWTFGGWRRAWTEPLRAFVLAIAEAEGSGELTTLCASGIASPVAVS
jgi:hypothetical protein